MSLFTERRVSFASDEQNIMTQTEFKSCLCQDETLQTDTDENKPKLQIQKMPVVDIRGGMTLQTLKPIEIPPQPNQANTKGDNVHYEEIKENCDSDGTSQIDVAISAQIEKLVTAQLATQTETVQQQKTTQTEESVSSRGSIVQPKILLTPNLKKKLSQCCPSFAEGENEERDRVYASFQLYSNTNHEPEPLEKKSHTQLPKIEEQVYRTFIDPKGFPSEDSVLLYENSDGERRLSCEKERTPSHVIDSVLANDLTDYETDDEMKEEPEAAAAAGATIGINVRSS